MSDALWDALNEVNRLKGKLESERQKGYEQGCKECKTNTGGEGNLLLKLNETAYELTKYKKKLMACEVRSSKYFEYELNTRKNGSKYIRVLIYSNEHFNYIEVGRFNLSKNEWVQNNFSVEDVLEDIKS